MSTTTDNGQKLNKSRYFVQFVMKIKQTLFIDVCDVKQNFMIIAYNCGSNRVKHVQIVDYNSEKCLFLCSQKTIIYYYKKNFFYIKWIIYALYKTLLVGL